MKCRLTVLIPMAGCLLLTGFLQRGPDPREVSREAAAQDIPHTVLLGGEADLSYVSRAIVRDSLIYVLQPMEASVRVFTTDGREVRTIGREGRGPGEFAHPRNGGFMRDSLWVHDGPLGRVSWFGAGAFGRSDRFSAGHAVLPIAPGRYVIWGGAMGFPRMSIVDGTGAELVDLGTYGGADQMDLQLGTWSRVAPQPYDQAPRIAALDDSVWIAGNRRPTSEADSLLTLITVASDGGRRESVVGLRPRRLHPDEREAVIEKWVGDIVDFARSRQMDLPPPESLRSLVEDAIEWPEYLPFGADLPSGCHRLLLIRGLGNLRFEWIQIEGGVPVRRMNVPAGWRAVSQNCDGVVVVRDGTHDVPEVIQVPWPIPTPRPTP